MADHNADLGGKQARISIRGSLAVLTPALPDLLAPLLTFKTKNFEDGGRYGFRLVRGRQDFFQLREDGTMVICEGFVPMVVDFLERAGYRVTVDDRRRCVSIVVEGPEHGRQLLRRLPGWRLLLQETAIGWSGFHRSIVTVSLLNLLTSYGANVIIRADGTKWPIFAGALPRDSHRADDVVIVDFIDEVDRDAMDASRSRAADYEAKGWPQIEMTEPQPEPIVAQADSDSCS